MIKHKMGSCPHCTDGKDKPLIAGLCQRHYWMSKAKPSNPKKRKPIKPISTKLSKERKKYKTLQESFLEENMFCEARLIGCQYRSGQVHHKGKRGKNLCNVSTFMAVCQSCHDKIEVMSIDEAVNKGFRFRVNSANNIS